MIKVGQVRQWRRKSMSMPVIVITSINEGWACCVHQNGKFFGDDLRYISEHYKTIAEYPTWQEAVNSKEFKE